MSDNKTQIKRPKPVVLVVLDGWGIGNPYIGNAITQAHTPAIDNLISEYPSTTLRASGEAVGLPWGEAGNSEVGHLNLGLGRILYQDLPRINKAINDREFYKNPVLLEAIEHAKKNNSRLHIMGLVSNGCVHASNDHLHALLLLCKNNNFKNVYIHAFLDGRDTSYNSGLNFIKGVEYSTKENGVGSIATICGRFYAMDRNNNWDRTAKAYAAIVEGAGNKGTDPVEAIKGSYKKKIYDEEFVPTVIEEGGKPVVKVADNDALIFYNYRPDRARQITRAFVTPDFDRFERPAFLKNLFFVTFTEYEKGLPVHVAFPPEDNNFSLGEVISAAGLKQLRIAETEKYAHVTYFFNGGRETKSEGEDHVLLPSPMVSSYDQKPEMAALDVTKRLLELIDEDKYDFILVNYANADMVGHTGNIKAAVKAIETIDKCLDKLSIAVLSKKGVMVITADHGNAEIMFNMQTGQIDKEHTSDPVPLIVVGKDFEGRNFGWPSVAGHDLSMIPVQGVLADVAPTILKIMDIAKPKAMRGRCLI